MSHLINDNHVNVYGTPNHIGGIDSNSGRHLVVVKQRTDWRNKEMVVTPTEQKYFTAWSLGEERYPSTQGGILVYNDTNILLNNVKSKINSSQQWKNGNCALFSVFSRAEGPYAKYDEIINSGELANLISEFGTSVVAYKFNMRHLHFSKMTNFKVYARCWAPSLVASEPTLFAGDGILISGSLYNNASKLRIKFFDELPSLTYNLATSGDSLEFGNHSNNGRVVTKDTLVKDVMVVYEPFNIRDMFGYGDGNSTRIYTLQDNQQTPMPRPTNYYHDFELTNETNLNFLRKNPGEFWAVMHFTIGNAFAQGAQANNGLAPARAITVFSERVELVLKCNCNAFNI